MDIEKAKLWFDGGLITAIEAHPAPMASGWMVELRHRAGGTEPLMVARTDRHKVYKTLDAAHRDARRIGFNSMVVQFGR